MQQSKDLNNHYNNKLTLQKQNIKHLILMLKN